MAWRGFDPVYDRGQFLIDRAVAQVLGGEKIRDFQGLRHLAPVNRGRWPPPAVRTAHLPCCGQLVSLDVGRR
jgi:hypothetical protein